MACDISKGRTTLPCKDDVSGIKAIYVTNYAEYAFTTSSTSAGHLVTALTGLSSSNTFKFELKNSGNTFNQDITSSRDNGTTVFTQTLNFILNKLTATTEFQVKMMAFGRPIIFVEANSGQIFVIGKDYGCEITGKAEIQGTIDALNGYTMTAVATEKDSIYYLDSATVTALKAVVSPNNL
jgi:hypothetical protein